MNRGTIVAVAGAVAAAFAPLPVQLIFAIIGIGLVGMVHGAGDLAVVRRDRRVPFLAIYGLVSATTLLWWVIDPVMALPVFLIASAIHFAVEDVPHRGWLVGAVLGVALIAAPATLNASGYEALLRDAGGPTSGMVDGVILLRVAGGLAAASLLLVAWRRWDARLGGGVLALLLLPPFVGFTIGFLVLHALPQTAARQQRLGCPDLAAYLRTVGVVATAALLMTTLIIALLLSFDPTGVRALFAAVAALAIPHLLVTPWFEERGRHGQSFNVIQAN